MSVEVSMVVTRITIKHTLDIPDEYREALPVGQEVAITLDKQWRMVVTPIEKIRAALMESFGMWAERSDIPADSVQYVREVRKGYRIDKYPMGDVRAAAPYQRGNK